MIPAGSSSALRAAQRGGEELRHLTQVPVTMVAPRTAWWWGDRAAEALRSPPRPRNLISSHCSSSRSGRAGREDRVVRCRGPSGYTYAKRHEDHAAAAWPGAPPASWPPATPSWNSQKRSQVMAVLEGLADQPEPDQAITQVARRARTKPAQTAAGSPSSPCTSPRWLAQISSGPGQPRPQLVVCRLEAGARESHATRHRFPDISASSWPSRRQLAG